MSQVCMNPGCQKDYNPADKGADTDFCSFECWEKVNCHEPHKVIFEELMDAELKL